MKSNKKVIISIVCTTVICVIAGAIGLEWYLQSNRYDDNVVEIKIDSKIMNEERKVIIHLPENYETNTNKNYPVMYVLDGTSQDEHTFAKIDLLSKIQQFPEAIVVGIPNTRGNRSRDFTPHFMKIDIDKTDSDLGNGNNFLEFIEKELIAYIDKNYRTSRFKTLSGNSRGGLFVMYALIQKPQLFNGYMCYSPAFWREEGLIIKKAGTFFNINTLKQTFVYMSVGDSENDKMKTGFDMMANLISQRILKNKKSNNVEFIFQVTQNANHGTNAYKSTIYALDKLNTFLNSIENKQF